MNSFKKPTRFLMPLFAALLTFTVPSFLYGIKDEGANDTVLSLALQEDGKMLAGGEFTESHILRRNSDGTPDLAFSKTWQVSGFNGPVHAIQMQPDQKILVGGAFSRFDISLAGSLVRLNTDGSLDSQFSKKMGVGFDDLVTAVDVQSDGKIWVGGKFHSFDGTSVGPLIRLNADGTLDPTMTAGEDLDNQVHAIKVSSLTHPGMVGGDFRSYFKLIEKDLAGSEAK